MDTGPRTIQTARWGHPLRCGVLLEGEELSGASDWPRAFWRAFSCSALHANLAAVAMVLILFRAMPAPLSKVLNRFCLCFSGGGRGEARLSSTCVRWCARHRHNTHKNKFIFVVVCQKVYQFYMQKIR